MGEQIDYKVFVCIALVVTWLMWPKLKRWLDTPVSGNEHDTNVHEQKQAEEYIRYLIGLDHCNTIETLLDYREKIKQFQSEYNGLKAEQQVNSLLSLYEDKEKEILFN